MPAWSKFSPNPIKFPVAFSFQMGSWLVEFENQLKVKTSRKLFIILRYVSVKVDQWEDGEQPLLVH